MTDSPLRIALTSYRGNPRSGGQGVYLRLLSRELVALGHRVDVWSGPPYPELADLEDGLRLIRVPSLDLWKNGEPWRWPPLGDLRDPVSFGEWARTRLGEFAEPRAFCRRIARRFAREADHYDVLHDNQSLGDGLLALPASLPVVATIHHPITRDLRLALDDAEDWTKRFGLRRFYSFLPMQLRVARRLDRILTVSEASARDLESEYGVAPERLRVVGNGIDVDRFRPLPGTPREADRLIATISADVVLKGLRVLLRAVAALKRERPGLALTVVGGFEPSHATRSLIAELDLGDAVTFTGRIRDEALVQRYAESSVAVVPSLYEGFGFPAGEAMACELPVVTTRGGALPEVVGDVGTLVESGSAEALAEGLRSVLAASSDRRAAIGARGRRRVLEHFTWRRAAERTVDGYREAIAERSAAGPRALPQVQALERVAS